MLDIAAPVMLSPWSTAVPDWKDRIVAGQSLIPALPLDAERADRALRIFKGLRCPDIEGTPTYGDICEPWVFELVRAVFGAFDRETTQRVIREYFVLIPKKNGKTSIAAAIIVVAQILNERPAAELLLIAPTKKIADTAFMQADGIIRRSSTPNGTPLDKLFTLHGHERKIRHRDTAIPSTMSIKAADVDAITGSKATFILIDETHEFGKNRNAAAVLVEIRGGLSHPDNKGFLLQITTQSKDPPQGVFKDELKLARRVRDGEVQSPMLPLLYELPPELAANDGWRNPDLWGMVNPHLGRSVSIDFLADELMKADEKGAAAVALFASQHLNVEVGMSLHGEAWPGAAYWKAAVSKRVRSLEDLLDLSEVVTIGIDGGGEDDLFGLSAVGRLKGGRGWRSWSRAWCDPVVLTRRPLIAPKLRDIEAAGDLVICEAPDQDLAEAAAICVQCNTAGLLPEKAAVGLDQHGGALALIDVLIEAGLTADQLTYVGQAYKLQPASITLVRKMKAGEFRHADQPLMDWCVGNAKQELRGSNYVITKQAAGSGKIDPLVALFDAAFLMLGNPVAAGSLAFEYNGL